MFFLPIDWLLRKNYSHLQSLPLSGLGRDTNNGLLMRRTVYSCPKLVSPASQLTGSSLGSRAENMPECR